MVGATTYVVALIVLVFVPSRTAPHPPFPRRHAVTGALHDRDVRSFLRAAGWTRARVIALDREEWRVTFMNGSRLVLDAAVDPRGRVTATEQHLPGTHPPGSKILWSKPMLLLLLLVFALVTSVRPLRRVRNLDVLVSAAGF